MHNRLQEVQSTKSPVESRAPSDQQLLPVIRLDEDARSPPAAIAASRDEPELLGDKPSYPASPIIVEEAAGQTAAAHADVRHVQNDNRMLPPVDRKPSTEDV